MNNALYKTKLNGFDL